MLCNKININRALVNKFSIIQIKIKYVYPKRGRKFRVNVKYFINHFREFFIIKAIYLNVRQIFEMTKKQELAAVE